MEIKPENMMPIPIDDIVNGVKAPCDLFVRLNQERFVQVANAGTTTNIEQLSNYQAKSVTYLWVLKKEYYKMVHQATSLAGVLVSRKDVSDSAKTDMLGKAAGTVFRQVENMGMDLNTYGTARQVSEAVLALSEHHTGLTTILESLKKSNDYLLSHSIAVSVMSTILGQEMNYEKKATLEKLALAGLLHDIGLKTLPPALQVKSILEMTTAEIQHWETHSFRGMQMLQAIGIVPDDVVTMIYEHHENSIGQGFPQMIREVKLHPLGKITALANQFCELTLPGPNTPIPKNSREAVIYIEHQMGQPFNKECFKALLRIINKEKEKAA